MLWATQLQLNLVPWVRYDFSALGIFLKRLSASVGKSSAEPPFGETNPNVHSLHLRTQFVFSLHLRTQFVFFCASFSNMCKRSLTLRPELSEAGCEHR